MRVHKRTDVSFSSAKSALTAYDIASNIRILAGQKVVIQYEQQTIAEYNNCTEVERDRDDIALLRTVDFIGWLGPQLVIYVGGEDGP